MSREYIAYEAAHLCFGLPEGGAVAEGQLFDAPHAGAMEIFAEDGKFTVKQDGKEIAGGSSIAEAISGLGAYDIERWLPEYDEEFAAVVDEDAWDSALFEEAIEDEETPEQLEAIEAYQARFE